MMLVHLFYIYIELVWRCFSTLRVNMDKKNPSTLYRSGDHHFNTLENISNIYITITYHKVSRIIYICPSSTCIYPPTLHCIIFINQFFLSICLNKADKILLPTRKNRFHTAENLLRHRRHSKSSVRCPSLYHAIRILAITSTVRVGLVLSVNFRRRIAYSVAEHHVSTIRIIFSSFSFIFVVLLAFIVAKTQSLNKYISILCNIYTVVLSIFISWNGTALRFCAH